MSPSSLSRAGRRPAARLGVVFAVGALVTLLWAPAANAAPALTIPLDPDDVMVVPYPAENSGPLTLESMDSDTYQPVQVQWGGTVVLQLPTALSSPALQVTLGLAPSDEDDPTLEYSTENSPPDLTVTPMGGGQYSVTLPADNASDGPIGYLSFDNLDLASPIAGVMVMPAEYLLEFGDPSAPATQNLSPGLIAISAPSSCVGPPGCPVPTITAGQQFAVTVPASSTLRQLGMGNLDDMLVILEPMAGDRGIELSASAAAGMAAAAAPPTDPRSPLRQAMAAAADAVAGAGAVRLPAAAGTLAASAPGTTFTVPADVAAGSYLLTITETSASGGLSVTMLALDVKAVPRALNVGLRSDTGWEEPPAMAPSPRSSLIAIGAGLLLVAGLGSVAVLQGRRAGSE